CQGEEGEHIAIPYERGHTETLGLKPQGATFFKDGPAQLHKVGSPEGELVALLDRWCRFVLQGFRQFSTLFQLSERDPMRPLPQRLGPAPSLTSATAGCL
ncbi:MAG: hypothetical protein SWE60_15035, partial [Thermodesulfobacteriota bacterium]|nr:hypothetical protein [Thermodesulfobacteriota bacterium]